MNKFKYSDDNKRYHTFNYYLRHTYGAKVFKVSLNTNLGCPNRDGTCGFGGCTFCSSLGSGDMAGNIKDDLNTQFNEQLKIIRNKWPKGLPMAYFQAYSNTYAPLNKLKEIFEPFANRDDIIALAIATRPDCLEEETILYLESLCDKKDIWIELGLQTIHENTSKMINRGHDLDCFLKAVDRLKNTRMKVCVHLMNGLPYETDEMMIESAKLVGSLPIDALKIHMLHIIKNTKMGKDYLINPFHLLTKDEYIDIVVRQLEYINEEIVIERVTGDPIKENLIGPEWTTNKTIVMNDIDKLMVKRDTYQGIKFK